LPRKILLADDSVTAQNMGRKILAEAGYEVITVNNGAAAMKKISETKPDLVVLDVHMPGYSGLEVCQRLRETPKLARIPVLLTVGKLEPFRADDARRVNADAYVIKPFEATELLAVLTRLEDKIVPATLDSEDDDRGWRSRLRIPAPYMKRDEAPSEQPGEAAPVEPVAPPTQGTAPQAQETAPAAETATPSNVVSIDAAGATASLPQEMASEEASAAPVSMASQPTAGHIEPAEPIEAGSEPTGEQPASVTFSVEAEASSESFTPAPAPAEGTVAGTPAEEPAATDEVAAALASLVPAAAAMDQASDAQPAPEVPEYAATVTAAGEMGTYAGPRWIADEVPVLEEESALVLELEMQRAYAAFAAADAARLANYSPTVSVAHRGPVAFAPEFQVQTAEEPRETAYDAEVAAKVAAYIDSEEDLIYSEIAAAAASKTEDAAQPVPDAASAAAEPDPEEKVAYAVASAGAAAVSSASMPVEPATEAPEVAPAPAEPVSERDAQLATAWEQWKHIRESVVSPEFTAEVAESPAAVVQETPSEPALASAQPETSEAAADEANEIASIVDSVLADLKPKLMEEIAKKMGKSKKR
jgi:CheY-like chemotaxis protein